MLKTRDRHLHIYTNGSYNDDSAEVVRNTESMMHQFFNTNSAQIADVEFRPLTSSNLSGQLAATDPDASAVLSYGIYTSSTSNSSSNIVNGTYGQPMSIQAQSVHL